MRGKLAAGNWQTARATKPRAVACSEPIALSLSPAGDDQGPSKGYYPSPITHHSSPSPRRERGVTLVELVISIVVISIAVAAILGVLSMAAKGSADAMIRNQAVAIASAYLEEIRMKNFTSDGVEASRSLYDDVSDYNGLSDAGAKDQLGTAITGLSQYTVTVAVGAGTVTSIPSTCLKRVDVRVQHTTGVDVRLSGYRADYADPSC